MSGNAYNIGALIATMGLDTTQFQAGMASVNKATASADAATKAASASMSASMNAAAVKMQAVGKKMQQYLTLPILAVGVASTKVFSDFESSMAKITGLVGVAKDQVEEWKAEVLKLGPATGQGPEKLADALFFITSAGIRGAEAMEVLEMSAKAATAGLGEAKVVADLVTSAMNAYGKENLNAANATDILVATVREGKAEASSLAAAMGMVLPIASAYGVSFNEVGAAFAAMTRTGTNARVAATQLKAVLSSMASPSEKAEKAMAKYGTSSAEFRQNIMDKGLIGALLDLRDATNGNKVAMAEIFPNIRGLMATLDLLGSNVEDNVAIFKALEDPVGALDVAFESASQTIKFKFAKGVATLKTNMINLGTALSGSLLPVLEKVTNFISNATEKWIKMSDGQRQNRIRVLGLTAAMGPLLKITGALIKMLATPKGPYAMAIAGAIALTLAIRKLVMKHREEKAELDAVGTANQKIENTYEKQAVRIKHLTGIIEDVNVSQKGRIEAINEMKRIMPDYNGAISDEGVLTGHSKKAIDDYLVSLKEKIKLQVFEAAYVESLKQEVQAQRDLDKAITAAREAQEAFDESGGKRMKDIPVSGGLTGNIGQTVQALGSEAIALDEANQSLADRQAAMDKTTQATADLLVVMDQLEIALTAPAGGGGGGGGGGKDIDGIDYEAYFKRRREYIAFRKQSEQDLNDSLLAMSDDINKQMEDQIQNQLKMEEDAAKKRMAIEQAILQDKISKAQQIVQIGQDLAASFGEAISGVDGAYKSMVTTMLEGANQIISALLAQAVAAYIADKAAIPGGLIAAAVGVPVLIGMWNNLVPEFASGGLAYGPVVGKIGEYPGARQNPEVIAPLSDLKKHLAPTQGNGQPAVIELVLRGRDAYAMVKLEELLQNTY